MEDEAGNKGAVAKEGLMQVAGDPRVSIKYASAILRAHAYIERLEAENERLTAAVQRAEK